MRIHTVKLKSFTNISREIYPFMEKDKQTSLIFTLGVIMAFGDIFGMLQKDFFFGGFFFNYGDRM